MENLTELFKEPTIIAIIGDPHTGKTNLIYHIAEELQSKNIFNLYTYGLRGEIPTGAKNIYSTDELEKIKNSVIFLDEFSDVFDLDDRKNKSKVERTLRLLFHNNNIILLCGLPENFKKFISAKVRIILYKQVTFEDFINGSSVKKNILKYHGKERGSSVLNLGKEKCIVYDGEHYCNYDIPYIKDKDSKLNNVKIVVPKNVPNFVELK